MKHDGHASLKVASRVGILHLPRQVLESPNGSHRMPGNDLVPEHGGMVITRGLREWSCLLPLEIGFQTVRRLLGWITREPAILSATEVRRLVRQHGQELAAAEGREIAALLARPAGEKPARPRLVKATPPRRKAAWPKEMQGAVEAALAEEAPEPPEGISRAEWARVLSVRREEGGPLDAAALARLGPTLAPGEAVAAVDEVLVRTPEPRGFGELRTARIATGEGYRYLCGVGDAFVQLLVLFLPLLVGREGKLSLVSDGARWLEPLITALRERLPVCEVILDWYHLTKKCKDRISRMGLGRLAGRAVWKEVRPRLWRGEIAGAIERLEEERGAAKQEGALEEVEQYLRRHEATIPDYGERYQKRQYIGSGLVEKANDLLVARRQKRKGMHWSGETSVALARLKMLMLNHEWDAYWHDRRLPRLLAA